MTLQAIGLRHNTETCCWLITEVCWKLCSLRGGVGRRFRAPHRTARGTGRGTTREALHGAPRRGPARICGADRIFRDWRLLPGSIKRL